MKTTLIKTTLLLLAGTALWRVPAAFSAEPAADLAGRFYLTAHGGVAWLENVGFRNDTGSGTFRFDPGARLDVAGGYLLTPSLGVEVETGLTVNHVRGFSGGFFDENSVYLLQIPILANVQWRIPTHSRLKPFIGAGIGGVYSRLENWSILSDESTGDDFTFGFQGVAGLRYQINPGTELGVAYKFLGTTDHRLEHMDGTRSHSVLFSFSMKF